MGGETHGIMNETANELFTAKHDRALRIATVLRTLAWVALVIYLLRIVGWYQLLDHWYQTNYAWDYRYADEVNNVWDALNQDRVYAVKALLGLALILLRGMTYWLVLRGAAAALSIVVETDLNLREIPQGGDDE